MEIKFTDTHEWLKITDDIAEIGISDYAQEQLGDIVFVELPEVGDTVTVGESFAEVESVKAVSEVYSPVTGEVVEVNSELDANPAAVNEAPYDSWFVKVRFTATAKLMSEADYKASLK